ncbi:MerR family transcriptional regulator [Rubritalea sp.]|uniref:MerR family transcriptional regulator n=1 Tax=Rubritalea sp. TaxID=2109375 RepID=UPI003EF8D9AA
MHGIKIATLKSGLTSHAIRMWENRYGAVKPERSSTNRRLYSDQSIQRLIYLADLTKNGHSIGQIANLSDDELSKLHQSLETLDNDHKKLAKKGLAHPSVIQTTLSAISNFDQITLEHIFDEVVKEYGYSYLLEKVLIPLVQTVGELWHAGDFTIAEEHAATSFIKDYLCLSTRPFATPTNAPKLLITTPQGQLHELVAVISASQARKLGWHVIYLGPSLPAEEIAGAAEKIGARAIILSIVYPLDDSQINKQLHKLRSQLDSDIPIIVGGPRSTLYTPTLQELNIKQLSNFSELSPELNKLRN